MSSILILFSHSAIAPLKQNLQLLVQQHKQLPPRGALLQVLWLALIVLGPGRRPGVICTPPLRTCQLCKITERIGTPVRQKWRINPDRRSAVSLSGTGAYWGGLALTGLNPAVLRKGVTSGALCVPPPGVIHLPNSVQARVKV